jgi:hypothetical protein
MAVMQVTPSPLGSNFIPDSVLMCICAVCVQVRQPLYTTSVQRWRQYKQQLEPLREVLAPLIGRYEQMLQERLQKPVKAAGSTAAANTAAGGGDADASSRAAALDASEAAASAGGAEQGTDYPEVKDEL